MTTTLDPVEAEQPSQRSQRPALLVLGAVALLLVGVALGSLLRLPLGEQGLAVPAADSVDVGFAQDMTVHHTQAVQLANIAYGGTGDTAVETFAFDVASTQEVQIGQMQGWLGLWGQPLYRVGGYMGWMSADGGHSGMDMGGMDMGGADTGGADTGGAVSDDGTVAAMPGMATGEEIAELRTMSGNEADVRFLQLLLRHHQGGAEMLTYAAERALDPTVRQFAATVAATQAAESAQMTLMLTERGARPLDG